jgi:DUF3102 family protein
MKDIAQEKLERKLQHKLAVLRKRFKVEHAAVFTSIRSSLRHAIAAGKILAEVRRNVSHGEWLPFLKSAGVSERTAQRYLQLARGRHRLATNPTRMSDLTVSEALAILARPKPEQISLATTSSPAPVRPVQLVVSAASPERTSENVVVPLRPAVSPDHERARSSASAVLGVIRHLAEIADQVPGLAYIVDQASDERETLIEDATRCRDFCALLLQALGVGRAA